MGWKDALSYSTTKIADIKSWKLGIIYYLICLIILSYVVGWAIVYKKGYQESSNLVGYVNLKTKNPTSIGYTNISGVITPWDAQDVVNPPEENGNVFITTAYQLLANQTRDLCPSTGAPCPCSALAGTTTPNGIVVDQCDIPSGQCLQESWCPQAAYLPPQPEIIYNVNTFTVFAKVIVSDVKKHQVSAKWPEWPEIFVTNYNETGLAMGYNLFTLDMILQAANTTFAAVQQYGAVILATAHYDCNFDLDVSECQPVWSFLRIDAVLAVGTLSSKLKDSNGSNYYAPDYYYLPVGPNGSLVEYRNVWKWYGVNIVFQVTGAGGKFNVVPLLTALGSGIGLLAVATVVVDVLVLYIHPKRKVYSKYKVEYFDDPSVNSGEKKPLLDQIAG